MARKKRCGHCYGRGHNRRTCPSLVTPDAPKKKTSCGWCKELGHNARTCPSKKHSKSKLAELQPLLETHVSNTLTKLGVGRGALLRCGRHRKRGVSQQNCIVTGFVLDQQRWHGGVHIHHYNEPKLKVIFTDGDREEVWLPAVTLDVAKKLVSDTPKEYQSIAATHFSYWGYGSNVLVVPSSEKLTLARPLVADEGQHIVGLDEWKENLTTHLANVKKCEDSKKDEENA